LCSSTFARRRFHPNSAQKGFSGKQVFAGQKKAR
jgi:hypothetical protein